MCLIQWSAADALALKWVELSIRAVLPQHKQCEHVKGHGGGVQSAHRIANIAKQRHYHYVCRTDILGYYRNINKTILLKPLQRYIHRPAFMQLLTQYINYTVEDGGEFYTPAGGIC